MLGFINFPRKQVDVPINFPRFLQLLKYFRTAYIWRNNRGPQLSYDWLLCKHPRKPCGRCLILKIKKIRDRVDSEDKYGRWKLGEWAPAFDYEQPQVLVWWQKVITRDYYQMNYNFYGVVGVVLMKYTLAYFVLLHPICLFPFGVTGLVNNVKYRLARYFTFPILWRILSWQLNLNVLLFNSFLASAVQGRWHGDTWENTYIDKFSNLSALVP